ncbi:hypothetical protein ACSBR2_021547 [Camellia fascicularis]
MLLLGAMPPSILILKEITTIHELMSKAKKKGTLARLATQQGSPIRVDITKKTTSRYGRTDAYGGTRK